jgi:hypothetical protein
MYHIICDVPNSLLTHFQGTYDPNWREFVGIQLIQILEEFPHLIDSDLTKKIIKALEIQAVGAMRRNGTFPDNLIDGYSNPSLMRAVAVGWIGARTNNKTFIDFANEKGTIITELFKLSDNTFSEYKALTYWGIDIFALAASIKYGPKTQTLTKNAPFLMTKLWEDIAGSYNPYLGNFVGPYDRANSRDLTQHSAVLPLWFWGLFGYTKAAEPNKGEGDLEYDAAEAASMALVMSTVEKYIPSKLVKTLTTAPTTDHTVYKTVRDSIDTEDTRIATSWLSKPLMVGGMEVNETTARSKQFVPAIVHWASDPTHKPFPYNGLFSLYPHASTIKAVASKNKLVISYPNTTQDGTSTFEFMLSGIPPTWTQAGNAVSAFSKLPCLNAKVSAPGLELQPMVYGGSLYGSTYYNVTYVVPAKFVGTPKISFDLKYTC